MTIADQLAGFLQSSDPAVARSAAIVKRAAEQRAAGKISAEEYETLCKGATDLATIRASMNDADTLQQAQEAINIISKIAASYI